MSFRLSTAICILFSLLVFNACSKSPHDKALLAIDNFLNKNIADIKSIELIEQHGPDSLFCNFDSFCINKAYTDSIKDIMNSVKMLSELVKTNALVGINSSNEAMQLEKSKVDLNRISKNQMDFLDVSDFNTDQFTIYRSFRYNLNGQPTIENIKFFFDGEGNLLGWQNLKDNSVNSIKTQ